MRYALSVDALHSEKMNGEWKVGQAKFQGYMKAKMENITKIMDEIKAHNELQDIKINTMEKDVSGIKAVAAFFGAAAGSIVMTIAYLFNLLKRGG